MARRPHHSTLFPYTTLFRSSRDSEPSGSSRVSSPSVVLSIQMRGSQSPLSPQSSSSISSHQYACRSEEHTSELQSRQYLVCRRLLEKKNRTTSHLHVSIVLV